MLDFRIASREFNDPAREFVDCDFLIVANVVNLARDRIVIHQFDHGADRVADMNQRARLLAVAVDLDRLSGQR